MSKSRESILIEHQSHVAGIYGLGSKLVTGHREKYWNEAALRAIDEYASLKVEEAKESQWVSVKERLPEDGRYLCWVIEVNDLGKSGFVWNCSYSFRHGWQDNLQSINVTHWQPLPSPPKPITNL